ncbi:MAG: alpha/beta hydrolase [Ilumatobacter sp.]|nr:alpha/beta hydrolase [Ilumatobacter sp.]
MTERHHPMHLRDLVQRDHSMPPVVLVPGIDGTALLFYRQIPTLASRFDVVAFPLPAVDPHVMTMESLADDLATLVDEISDCGAILCGESFGGALAMTTALRHPAAVRGLVIVNSFPRIAQRIKLRVAPRLLKLMPWGAMPFVRRYTSAHLHSPHALPEDLHEFRERSKQIDRDAYIRRLEILQEFDIRDELHDIDVPTLFLAGDLDRLLPSVHWARYMHQRVGPSRLHVLEGYGHVCLINHDLDLIDFIGPWWEDVG